MDAIIKWCNDHSIGFDVTNAMVKSYYDDSEMWDRRGITSLFNFVVYGRM